MRPRLLDLFCGQGGAGMGYHRAGFEVTGVDLSPQPRYPFAFIQADALDYLAAHGHEYDVIHASPPCQGYSEATPIRIRHTLPRLIAPTREAGARAGKPYIIENVEGARRELRDPLMLCGTMFGLPVWRHRYFETVGFSPVAPSPCDHRGRPVTIHCGSNTRKTRGVTTAAEARAALGIDWMTLAGLYESIPPAYTEYLGRQLLERWG
jgi:DNA (cytosine-5)-methyltransferase 1